MIDDETVMPQPTVDMVLGIMREHWQRIEEQTLKTLETMPITGLDATKAVAARMALESGFLLIQQLLTPEQANDAK